MKISASVRVVGVLAGGIVAAMLAGCTATPAAQPALPPKNFEKWALPLDQFTDNEGSESYAAALVERPCYARHGIDWPVPWQPADIPWMSPSFTPGGHKLFNAELAAGYGYHTIPNDYEGRAEWRQFATQEVNEIVDATPGFEDIYHKCVAEGRQKLPLPSDEAIYYVGQARVGMSDKARESKPVKDAEKKWKTCIARAGHGGYADDPYDMPGDPAAGNWDISNIDTVASPEEKAVATADAACRDESGWSKALYEQEWKLQAEFVTQNADRLLRIRTELEQQHTRVQKIIAEHGATR